MRALVAAGPTALPALGAAGERTVAGPGGVRLPVALPVIEAIVAREEEPSVRALLGSPHARVREAAARELGRRASWGAVPPLLGTLADADLGVRRATAESLRRLTNEFHGYEPAAAPAQREVAARRWQSWWHRVGRARAPAAVPEARVERGQ
jgi:hypothetical protein